MYVAMRRPYWFINHDEHTSWMGDVSGKQGAWGVYVNSVYFSSAFQ